MVKNNLEKIFDFTYQTLWKKKFFLIRETDFPLYLIQQSKLRFKPPQMIDRILLNFEKNFALELKHSNSNSIPLERIKPHQLEFLKHFKNQCGESYFLFSFNDLEDIYLIPINIYLRIIETLQKKSLNINDLTVFHYNRDIYKIKLIHIEKKKKPILDLSILL